MKLHTPVEVNLLKYTFGLVPIVAGLDKFTHILTDWTAYLTPWMLDLIPFEATTFMGIVGIIEIAAGVLVLIKTHIGALVVSGWLVLIAFTLLIGGGYLDVAVRDLVMAVAAFSLAKLTEAS
ncbi:MULTISPECIES: hypothetical protein [Arenibacter]|uniref:hypothetical protein n=1 Tax=Arenibacter TaxID=178469 RepID=UPI000A3B5934|nr:MULTISPECIES: hypothetical protein [Arenibacter]